MTRSMLFVPGDSQRKFDKAIDGPADALILDLEDSVRPAQKAAARLAVAAALQGDRRGKDLWVRVNALESGLLLQDLAAVVPAAPFGIVLPKCRGRTTLEPVGHYLDALETAAGIAVGSTRILSIATETGQSIFDIGTHAGVTPRLWGLTWGGEDLAADIGALGNRQGEGYTAPYRLARSLCLFAATAAGVRAIDAVCVDLNDDALLRRESQDALRDGFSGKLAIHPKHIETIHAGMRPSDEQLQWAHDVVAAFAGHSGDGALDLNGRMIDQPHLRLAQRMTQGR